MIEGIIWTTKTKLENITQLNYVDENWGQLDYYSNNPPVKWPCALIDIVDADFSNIGQDKSVIPINRQMGSYSIEILVADLKLTNTQRKAPIGQQVDALSIWLMIDLIHRNLQGWNPLPNSSKLIRTSLSRVKRDDGVQEYSIIYTGELQGC